MQISTQKIAQLFSQADATKKDDLAIPLYRHIYNILKEGILKQELPSNCELPATRKLADELRVSRSTLVKVYELLRLEGLIKAKKGSGHYIQFIGLEESQVEEKITALSKSQLSKIGQSFYENVNLVNTLEDKAIAFRPGLPPLDVFPITQWKKQNNKYWQLVKSSELSYHSEAGEEALRRSIAHYLNLTRNVKCDYNQVFVVGGSLQSLFLIGSLLLNAGDGIYLENPTFPNVHSVFKGLMAKIEAVDVDEDGINLNALKQKKESLFKLMHVTPSCHYPLGMQMSAARKKEVSHFASENKLYVIENDYEHEINQYQSPSTPLFTLDTEDRTFYLGTFNRILHPSIRIGFMVVPRHLTAPMKALMRHSHLFVSPSIQYTLNSFIDNKFLHTHVIALHKAIEEREPIVVQSLKEKALNALQILTFQAPSLHTTALLRAKISDKLLVQKILDAGIITHALSKCYIGEPKQQGLIIGHSCVRPQLMQKELNKLINAVNRA